MTIHAFSNVGANVPTLDEIRLTKEQMTFLDAMIAEVTAAKTPLKKLVYFQKHVKLIWDEAFSQGYLEGCDAITVEVDV